MTGTCIEKLPHDVCGSRDGLQVFEEGGVYTGYCFVCSTYIPDPYHDKPDDYQPMRVGKSEEEIAIELEEIDLYPSCDLPTRQLKQEYLDYFGVVVGVSQNDGLTPETVYFPYAQRGYKVRLLEPKKMWSVGAVKSDCLFGWNRAMQTGAKRLIITEGEFDAVALFQILKEQAIGTPYAALNPAIVSLPTGASGAVKAISAMLPQITAHFKEVVLCFDSDEPGQKGVEEVMKIAPHFMSATLPCKDANACIIEGRERGAKAAVLFKATQPKNTRILRGSQFREQAMAKAVMGGSWPWKGLTEATRGRRRGETIYIGAGVKMGKSEVVNAIGEHIMVEEDAPVLFVKPEEAPVKTYQLLVGKAAKRIFHDPNIEFDEEAYLKAEPLIGDRAMITDVYQFAGWETVKQDIVYAVSEGVKDVMIDPITCFTNQMSSSAANEELGKLSAELSAMAKDLDFTAYIFCHLKAPDGTPHERGGLVLSNQFAGSRAMMRSCNYMIGLEGNKDPELPIEERNLRDLVILEDREFGISARIPLYWDRHTGVFNEL